MIVYDRDGIQSYTLFDVDRTLTGYYDEDHEDGLGYTRTYLDQNQEPMGTSVSRPNFLWQNMPEPRGDYTNDWIGECNA